MVGCGVVVGQGVRLFVGVSSTVGVTDTTGTGLALGLLFGLPFGLLQPASRINNRGIDCQSFILRQAYSKPAICEFP